jgi:aminoglycoside phosphotransferase (APT) family kinase protein
MLEEIFGLLRDLNPPGANAMPYPLVDDRYREHVSERLDVVTGVISDAHVRDDLAAYFHDRLYGLCLPFGVLHGDFSVTNIYTFNGVISGLIDWETGSTDAPYILDAINYLDSVYRLFHKGVVSESIPALASARWESAAEHDFLHRQYAAARVDAKHHEALVYLRWLRHVSFLLRFWLKTDTTAIRSYVHDVVCAILGAAGPKSIK